MLRTLRSIFSFRGRINRIQFLVRFVGLMLVGVLFMKLDPNVLKSNDTARTIAEAIGLFAYVACFWANSVKRWHDSNRSGLYAFLNVVPVVGFFLNFLLNCLVAGTPDANRFGNPSR